MANNDTLNIEPAVSDLQEELEKNAEFYHAAAINSAHEAIGGFLRTRAQERMDFIRQLVGLEESDVAADIATGEGEEDDEGSSRIPQASDSLLSRLRRGMLTITAGMTIASENVDKRVLEEVQAADARLLEEYKTLLNRSDLDEDLRKRLEDQYQQIQATYAYTGVRNNRPYDTVVLGLFARDEDLHGAVTALEGSGLAEEQITVVGSQTVVEKILGDRKADLTASSSGVAALGGTLLGGFIGFLAGLGTVMIPGVGAVLAVPASAAVLGSTALGAGVGAAEASFLGMFIGLGVAEEDIHRYTTGVSQGEILLMAHVPADDAATVAETMHTHNGTDVSVRTDEQLARTGD